MPIVVSEHHPAREPLLAAGVECPSPDEAPREGAPGVRVGIVNLMPHAEAYEPLLLRRLGRAHAAVTPVFVRLRDHVYGSSCAEHLARHYVTYDRAIADGGLDGLVLTGAPVEELPFEQVRYWSELTELLGHARVAIASTLGLCWGGMALAKVDGVEKVALRRKLFGVYPLQRIDHAHPLLAGSHSPFLCPQSRHSGVDDGALDRAAADGRFRLIAGSTFTGHSIFESADGRFLAHLGHPEYQPERIVFEYRRDRARGRDDVDPPVGIDLDRPVASWGATSNAFFDRWIQSIVARRASRVTAIGLARCSPEELPSGLTRQSR